MVADLDLLLGSLENRRKRSAVIAEEHARGTETAQGGGNPLLVPDRHPERQRLFEDSDCACRLHLT